MGFRNLATFCTFLLVSVAFKNVGSVTTVNPETGGYTFTVAIDEGVPVPESVAALDTYVNNIRDTLQRFTIQLFLSTRGSFHVENVQILLPGSWSDLATAYEVASGESYSTADIRLSTLVSHPFVANPHACGKPGQYIELPHTFLNGNQADDTYGPIVKALLTQWARFRWGVWEEHGYTAERTKFPYFYRTNPLNNDTWEATSCSNQVLEGEYRTAGSGESCTAPESGCRFHPAHDNRATSSLMGYHWLESVSEFCDERTHNRQAPNKQNLYCENKSVWEVIRESPDYHTFEEPITEVPIPIITAFKKSSFPALHLLLDRGSVENPNNLILLNQIIPQLARLFNLEDQDEYQNTVASISVFGEEFETLVPWKKVVGNQDEFVDALGHFETEFPTFRDFSSALLQVASSVEKLDPTGGAVVMILKTGGVETNYGSLESEEEVTAALAKANVRLFAAEIVNTPELPFVNLKTLVDRTGGIHHYFNDSATAPESIRAIVNTILDVLNSEGSVPIERTTQILYKGRLTPSEPRTLLTPNGITNVRVHVAVSPDTVPVLQVGDTVLVGTSRNEWDEVNEPTHRIVHSYDVPASVVGNLQLQYSCGECHSLSEARVVVVGQPSATSPNSNVRVMVETSAINNAVDFTPTSQPFAIYTTVTLNYRPVNNVTVEATITDGHGSQDVVELLDDGTGYPDLEQGDGVYSGIYVPAMSGLYKVSVKVESIPAPATGGVSRGGQSSRLLPIDQEEIDCPSGECDGVELAEVYSNIFDISDITFSNVAQFPVGLPAKILDLEAAALHGPEPNQVRLRLTFSSPKIVGVSNSSSKATRYFIMGSNNFAELSAPTPGGNLVQVVTTTSPPGFTETFMDLTPPPTGQFYAFYAVHSAYSDFPLMPTERIVKSNIAQLVDRDWIDEDEPTTTTTTSTTQRTTTTTTTTEGPVDPTTESTDDDDKPFFKTAGGIVVIVLIVLIIGGAIGGGAYYFMKKKRSTSKQMLANDAI